MGGSRKRKILLLSFTQGSGSGAERILEHLLTEGCSQLSSEVAVMAPIGSGIQRISVELGYETCAWPARKSSAFIHDASSALRFVPQLMRLRPRSIHAWHTRCFEIAVILGTIAGTPVDGTMHDHPCSPGYSKARRFLMRWGANRMRRLACVSEALFHACMESGWRVPLLTIRNGIPDLAPLGNGSERGEPLRVGFLGAAERWKGGEMVLDLSRHLPNDRFRWNIYGSLTPASCSWLKEGADPGRNIRFHGRLAPEVIYGQNDVILHPSERFDPFPTVILEAMRAARPVVASRVGGTGEMTVHGETGLLFDAGDMAAAARYLESLAENQSLRFQLGAVARKRFLKEFLAARMLSQYTALWGLSP